MRYSGTGSGMAAYSACCRSWNWRAGCGTSDTGGLQRFAPASCSMIRTCTGPAMVTFDYGTLADDAERHGYHVAMATVPLDGWLVDPRAAGVFGRHPGALSLIVHGNDHIHGELARVRTAEGAESLARQALARIARLERRARLTGRSDHGTSTRCLFRADGACPAANGLRGAHRQPGVSVALAPAGGSPAGRLAACRIRGRRATSD